jgi:hypothetical protein
MRPLMQVKMRRDVRDQTLRSESALDCRGVRWIPGFSEEGGHAQAAFEYQMSIRYLPKLRRSVKSSVREERQMNRNLERFVRDQNIKKYKTKLEAANDDDERRRLRTMLAEEEAKAAAEAEDADGG